MYARNPYMYPNWTRGAYNKAQDALNHTKNEVLLGLSGRWRLQKKILLK